MIRKENIDIINDLAENPSLKHFQALEILASKSDGSLSEYMMDVAVSLLENNSVQFIEFLRMNQHDALFQSLTDGLSMSCDAFRV